MQDVVLYMLDMYIPLIHTECILNLILCVNILDNVCHHTCIAKTLTKHKQELNALDLQTQIKRYDFCACAEVII